MNLLLEISAGQFLVCEANYSIDVGVELLPISHMMPLVQKLNTVLPGQMFYQTEAKNLEFLSFPGEILKQYPPKFRTMIIEFVRDVQNGDFHAALNNELKNYSMAEKGAKFFTALNYSYKPIEFLDVAEDIYQHVDDRGETDYVWRQGQLYMLLPNCKALPFVASIITDNMSYFHDYLYQHITPADLKTLAQLHIVSRSELVPEDLVLPYIQKEIIDKSLPTTARQKVGKL